MKDRMFKVIGIVMWIVLVPILVINLTLIVKGCVNKDEVPSIGGYLPLIVLTDSMNPVIESGDLIICHEIDGSEVNVGDVISFFDPSSSNKSIVTHRVVEVIEDGSLSFRTRGDNNNSEDRVLVPVKNLVGKYQMRIVGLGSVALFMQSTSGLIMCVVLPIVLWVIWDMVRRYRYEKKRDNEMEDLMLELESLRSRNVE